VYQDVTSAFESFYTGTSSRLLRYAYGLTGDMAEAQDFTQEAYARAWQRWRRLQRYENPESWLRLVVSRLAVDRLRWLGVRRAKVQRGAQVVLPPNEEMLTLIAALKRLPMPQRKALVLHYFLDMPVAEIAVETGTNVNTVKTWLARGRVNVAAELTDVPPAKQDLQGVLQPAEAGGGGRHRPAGRHVMAGRRPESPRWRDRPTDRQAAVARHRSGHVPRLAHRDEYS
jgi:RNA polymerase sigma-70 factor (ECF subfamily)